MGVGFACLPPELTVAVSGDEGGDRGGGGGADSAIGAAEHSGGSMMMIADREVADSSDARVDELSDAQDVSTVLVDAMSEASSIDRSSDAPNLAADAGPDTIDSSSAIDDGAETSPTLDASPTTDGADACVPNCANALGGPKCGLDDGCGNLCVCPNNGTCLVTNVCL